ncbi:MAG: helix-turn-helix domain-containing protein [Lachnospiraceae bacterium]|nr:helix-turn-helix domain-containing protein [Lachnospiraceae bacterium]
MTQVEFSKRTGIATTTISDWRKKNTNPGSEKIMQICAALEVTPEYLLSGVCEDSDRGKAVDYMVIPQGTEERELLELFNEMQWLERTRLLEYAKKLSEKKNSPYDSQGKKAMKKIAEFCDVEIYMDEEFSGSPAVDVNYLDDDVQGSIDLEQGVIKGDFSKYVLPVIEAWLIEHREMLMEMWKAKKIGLIPAWE